MANRSWVLALVLAGGMVSALPMPALGQTPLSITVGQAVRDLDGDNVPDRIGETVRVTGTVTAPIFYFPNVGYLTFIQADAGVVLFSTNGTPLEGLRPGDRVEVTGIVGQYRGQELIYVGEVRSLGLGGIPTTIEASPGEIEESVSGRLVRVTGTLRIREDGGLVAAEVWDGSGSIPIFFAPELILEQDLFTRLVQSDGRRVRIRGVVFQDADPDEPGPGFAPREAGDLDLPLLLPIPEIVALLAVLVLTGLVIHLARRRRRAEDAAATQSALAAQLRESEAALRESEQRYRTLFENVAIGICQTGADGRVRSANRMLTAILGYWSVDDLIADGLNGVFVDPADRERFERRVAVDGGVNGFETRWRRTDGREIVVRMNARAIRDDAGEIRFIESTVEDVTGRFEAEEKLRQTEARTRQIAATSPTIIYAVTFRDGVPRTTWISEGVTRMLGYSRDEALEVSWWVDCIHPDDRGEAVRQFRNLLLGTLGASELTHEYRFRHSDGSYRWFRNDLRVVSRSDDVVEAVGASLDITAQKEMTLALSIAEERYRRLVETSPYGIFAVDVEGRVTEVNQAIVAILGRGTHELIGRPAGELIAPESRPAVRAEMEKARLHPTGRADYEAWILRPDGERRLVHIRSTPIVNDGRTEGAHGVVRDITEERGRENRLHLLGAALENLGHGVAVSGTDGQLIYANSEFANLLAFDPDRHPLPAESDFLPDQSAIEQLAEIREALRASGRWSGRLWRRRRGDARVIPLDAVIGNVPSPSGGPPHALTICHDASEAIQREQELRRAERLNSLSTLVGGVAHELNNPLSAIINFAGLLLAGCEDSGEREDLETIVREGERAAKIVSNLRSIARQAEIEQSPREPVDVNDVIAHVLKLRGYALATSNIAVDVRLGRDLPRVWADRGQMEQVVLNLVINAEQAMAAHDAEGNLRVTTRRGRMGVRIEVADDGPGIPSANLDRIFDPFWTTKPPGEGTGLGLSLVHNIVAEHGGVVDVRSEVGEGTRFLVEFPAVAVPLESAPRIQEAEAEPGVSLRVLVVDDEAAVRRSLVRYLERQGHRVEEAAEGGEALHMLERFGYDVILSDLKMPGINGQQLFAKLKEAGRGEDRKIIFMTGDPTGAEAAAIHSDAPLLIKPVKLADVASAVREKAAGAGPRSDGRAVQVA